MAGRKYTDDEVIAALMAHDTVREAAQALGCSTRTVYNYAGREGFAEKMRAMEQARASMLAGMVDNAVVNAIDCLISIMTADSSGLLPDVTVQEQIEAARVVLAYDSRSSALLSTAVNGGSTVVPQASAL